jgi:hypothetical protein
MVHTTRRFCVTPIATLEALVEQLTQSTWTRCTGFSYQGLVFLNDAFSEDGAQEYAVLRDGLQIESLTVSWCTPERLTDRITALFAGGGADLGPCTPILEDATTHGRCGHCA